MIPSFFLSFFHVSTVPVPTCHSSQLLKNNKAPVVPLEIVVGRVRACPPARVCAWACGRGYPRAHETIDPRLRARLRK